MIPPPDFESTPIPDHELQWYEAYEGARSRSVCEVSCSDCPSVFGAAVSQPETDDYVYDPRPFWRGLGEAPHGVRSVCCRDAEAKPSRKARLKAKFQK